MTLTSELVQLEEAQLIRRVLEPELTYLFRHALTQEAAYRSLLQRTRREVHQKVAEAYEQLYQDRLDEFASLLAHHYVSAGDHAKTLEFATRAGDRAARLYALAEARFNYALALQAVEHLPDTQAFLKSCVELLIQQVGVSWSSEDPEQNLAQLRQAQEVAQRLEHRDPLQLARVHYWMGRIHAYRNQPNEALRYYDEVLQVAETSNQDELFTLSMVMAGRALMLQGHAERAAGLLARALDGLERTGNWQEWVLVVSILGLCLVLQGQCAEGLAQVDRAVARAEQLADPASIAGARVVRAQSYFFAGQLERVMEEVDAGLTVARQAGNSLQVYMGLGIRAWAESRLAQHDAALATIAETNSLLKRLGGRLIFSDWYAVAGAEVALNAGRIERASTLAEEAARYAESVGGILAQGIAQRAWGQALAQLISHDPLEPRRWDEVDLHFAASLDAFEAGNLRLEAARTHFAWGKLLCERGELSLAREHLAKAAAQFEASGLERELEGARSSILELA